MTAGSISFGEENPGFPLPDVGYFFIYCWIYESPCQERPTQETFLLGPAGLWLVLISSETQLVSLPFRYLIKFLSKLSEYQDVNKMTPSNMAIVLGPNLLWPQSEG